MSTTDETKTAKTYNGTQNNYQIFMPWLKGIVCMKGITDIMKASFKSVLPVSENESEQSAKQKEAVKTNLI